MVDETSFDADWFRENHLGLLCESMSQCLSDLLQNKLLYQHCSVKIQRANLEKREENALKNVLAEFEQEPIFCTTQDNSSVVGAPTLLNQVVVPMTVCTDCETCHGETTPHNPIRIAAAGTPNREGGDQTFSLSYQCQKCKQGLLVFLVRRKGLKWQLVGRNQVPAPSIPASFPKAQEAFFRDAEMASRTGSHLAAVCLLRVALEQYLRAETGQSAVCSGDRIWDLYKQRLPNDFPLGRVCSLGEIYGRLSEVIHDPTSLQDDMFADCKAKLDHFFQFVALLPLVDEPGPKKEEETA